MVLAQVPLDVDEGGIVLQSALVVEQALVRGLEDLRPATHPDLVTQWGVIEASVGSTGDSYDNAAAEALNKLYKKELIWRRGPWRGLDDVELATLEWVDWYNNSRLHGHCGYIPPTELEDHYYADTTTAPATAETAQPALH